MDMDRVRIADAITTEYSDFLSFCSASGKIFISELTNVDFVAFRTGSGQSRDYIKLIRAMLDNPVVAATTEVDAVQKGSESVKNELQGDPLMRVNTSLLKISQRHLKQNLLHGHSRMNSPQKM